MTQHNPIDSAPRRFKLALLAIGAGILLLAVSALAYWLLTSPSDDAGTIQPIERTPEPSGELGLPWFRDATPDSGLTFTYRNGEEANQFTILESLGGGVALLDYDGDGRLDIFLTGGGSFDGPTRTEIRGLPCRLFRNLGHWKFEDVTEKVGFNRTWFYTHGVAVADYDRDGWPDLVVTGFGKIELFHNVPDGAGSRRFQEVGESLGLKDSSWSTSAGWADLDGDGYPELYVCHYVDWSFANNPACIGYVPGVPRDVCAPQRFKPLVHSLFKNEKGRSFRDIASEQGFTATGCGLGVVLADVNADGRPDIYVANDATNNFLFLNRGGKLAEVGWRSGVAVDDGGRYNGSMGTDVGDYDGTGRASIWVTNFQGELHALYRNLGLPSPNEAFDFQSRAVGLTAIGTLNVGFGSAFLDVDNDGWEDLAIAHGHVVLKPSLGSQREQKPVLLRNVERERRRFFENASGRAGKYFDTPAMGRGLAVGDLDNDGWPDLVIGNTNSPVAILRNVAAESTPQNRWLGVRLLGRANRDIVGSTVTLENTSRTLTRFAKGGGSYLSSGDRRMLFGLGESERVRKVTVKWSYGESQSWENLEPGAYWDLREGEPNAVRQAVPQ